MAEIPDNVKEEARSKAQEKGIEGFLKRYNPVLYEKLKALSEQTGSSIPELLSNYTEWALEIREYSTLITKEDLKNITPEALYSALKFILFFEERYIRTMSYISISNALAILDVINRLAQQQQVPPVIPTPPQPQPQPDRFSKLVDAVIRGIEAFQQSQEVQRKLLANEIATSIVRKAEEIQPKPQVKESGKQ